MLDKRLKAVAPFATIGKNAQHAASIADNAEMLFKMINIKLRWNTLSNTAEYADVGTSDGDYKGWHDFCDHATRATWLTFTEKAYYQDGKVDKHIPVGKRVWADFRDEIAYKIRQNPCLLWLDGLPEWDGVDRIGQMFGDSLDAMNRPIDQQMARILMSAIVQRQRKPGTEYHIVVVLIGSQGKGKSCWVNHILPPDSGWHHPSVSLAEREENRFVRSLKGRVVCALNELKGAKSATIEMWKDRISRPEDVLEEKWKEKPVLLPRRCVFVATANLGGSGVLPNDPTGMRRWYALEIGDGASGLRSIEYWEKNREQIFAQAREKDVNLWFSDEELAQQEIDSRSYEFNPHEELDDILDELIKHGDIVPETYYSTAEITKLLTPKTTIPLYPNLVADRLNAHDKVTKGNGRKRRRWILINEPF